MSTKFLSPGWRMPRNANQSKQSNYSMDFDGSSYIDTNFVPADNLTLDCSISAWVNMPAIGNNTNSSILGTYDFTDYRPIGGQNRARFFLRVYRTGGVYYYMIGLGTVQDITISISNFSVDTWVHLLVTYDGTDIKLYSNGDLDGTLNAGNIGSYPPINASFNGNTYIGATHRTVSASDSTSTVEAYLTGKIDAVSIFDYALSASQIATLWGGGTVTSNPMALPSSPIAYYPLGTSAWNGQYLAENNAIGDYVFDFVPNNYIDLGTPSTFAFGTGDFTIGGWVYLDSSTNYQWLFSTGTNFAFGFDSSRNLQLWVAGTATTPSFNINLNQWHHILATRNSGTVTFYIDGSAFGTTYSRTGSIAAGSYNYIGTFNVDQNHLDGKLSNAQIFNTALSATDVATLYNNGSPIRTLANIPQNSNLKAWYKLDASEIYNSVSTEWEVSDATAAIKNTILDPANSNPRPYFEENTPGNLLSLTGTAGQSITISLWYYASGNADNILFNKVENGAYWFGKQTSNNLRFLFTNSSLWTLGPSVPRNQWNYIVLTVTESGTSSGRTVKFYVNGGSPTTVTDSSSSLIDLTSQKNTFGASSYSSTNVDVLSSNYIYYNTALSDSEVVSLYNSFSPDSENTPTVQPALSSFPRNSNITGWFKSDGLDSSGQGNNGSAEGSILLGPAVSLTNGKSSGMSQANLVQSDLQTVAPYSKYAMRFDAASSDYIQTTFNPYTSIGDNTSWTVSSWVYVSNVTTQQKILGIYDTTRAARFWFGIVNGGILFGYGNRGVYPISGTSVSANSWQNIIVTYSTTTGYILVYVNASINGTYDYAGNSGNGIIANANITIGDAIGESTFVNGYISNISIWNAELTSAQVREIYNEGLPSNLNSHSAYSNLVAWWQLGENSSFTNNWIVADEKGTNNGESQNMGVDALVNGVGTTANGVSSGMSEGNLVGDAPYSTANAISSGMAVTARGTDVP